MKRSITAEVNLTVQLTVTNETWSGDSSVEQVHREGAVLALERLQKLCHPYVRIVDTPRVRAVIVEK